MEIKRSNNKPLLKNILLLSVLLIAIILIPVLITNIAKDPITKKILGNVKTTVSELSPNLKDLTIEISRDNYVKLKMKRDDALGKGGIHKGAGILIATDEDLVKANIQYENNSYKSMIRLKGDWTQHLLGDTWSFRVKLNDEQTIDGMRKFSLQHPLTRNYAGEWLFHELLKNDDILHLRYNFINVTLKITDELHDEVKELGVYALEEFFDKRLIEHNKRREGIILKLDEDPIWKERRAIMNQQIKLQDHNYFKLAQVEDLDIVPFGKQKILEDSTLNKQFQTARYLFKSFIDQKLPISDVFDVEKLANFNAICNILGANHALIHHNYRVYYNPINSKLEPIGFDADAIKKEYYFQAYLHAYDDLEYSEAYMAALERVTSEEYFNKLMNWPGLESTITLLKKAYPKYKFDSDYIEFNKKVIHSLLFPIKSLNVFLEKADANSITLSIANFNRYPAEILGLSHIDNRHFGSTYERIIIPANGKKVVTFHLDKNYQRLFINKKKNKVAFNLLKDLKKIQVDFRTLGTSGMLHCKILEWPNENISISETDYFRKKSNVHKFDFLMVDSTAKTITCKTGNWVITGILTIPPGFTFIINAGTTIELKSGHGNIISFSPIHLLGRKDAPVSIFTNTSAKGLLVLNAKDTSIVRHAKFEGLSAAKTQGWSVSGAVNFYDSPVKLYNCAFLSNRSEDALNIINTSFEMDNIIFKDIRSDAFDGDFVEGIVKNSFFNNIGNDAIDVSGSDIRVENVHITNAGDKGLSAGEESKFIAKNIVIKNSEIAIASKDKSLLQLSNCLLSNNQLSFTAFKKKSEFGPAIIEADSIEMIENKINYLIETGSKLLLNGKEMETADDVLERMYGVEFGKKSQ